MLTQRCWDHLQRQRKMAEIIHSHDCQAVLDIGCGDGRLLEHLLLQVDMPKKSHRT